MRTFSWMGAIAEDSTFVAPDSPVGTLVSRAAIGICGSATLAEAGRVMRDEDVSSLLVDGGEAVVTERDITRGIGAGAVPDEPVRYVATSNPLIVDWALPIGQCAAIMLSEGVRHVVVSMPDSSPGVVSLRAVATVLLQHVSPQAWGGRLASTAPENWLG